MKQHTKVELEELTEAEARFIEHTGYLFDWSECEGLMGDDRVFIHKDDLKATYGDKVLEEVVKMLDMGYTALPF